MNGILCFGDSITYGRGTLPSQGWCYYLKQWFEKKDEFNVVYNLGIPGETSEGLLARIDREANARIHFNYSEDKFLILIAIGTNDAKKKKVGHNFQPRSTALEYERNIWEILKIASKYDAKVALFGIPPCDEGRAFNFEGTRFTNDRLSEFNTIAKDVAKEQGVPFLDLFHVTSTEPEYFADGLHPNDIGYQALFVDIREFLQENELL
jgi:acyl-CoA thioesterase I